MMNLHSCNHIAVAGGEEGLQGQVIKSGKYSMGVFVRSRPVRADCLGSGSRYMPFLCVFIRFCVCVLPFHSKQRQ